MCVNKYPILNYLINRSIKGIDSTRLNLQISPPMVTLPSLMLVDGGFPNDYNIRCQVIDAIDAS